MKMSAVRSREAPITRRSSATTTTIWPVCMETSRTASLLHAGREPGALLALRHADLAARWAFVLCFASAYGHLSGTRILFNYGDAVREATLTNQFYSLYDFLLTCKTCNGAFCHTATAYRSAGCPHYTRTYEGGFEQKFFSDRLVFRSTYFHNQFGKEIESVSRSCAG